MAKHTPRVGVVVHIWRERVFDVVQTTVGILLKVEMRIMGGRYEEVKHTSYMVARPWFRLIKWLARTRPDIFGPENLMGRFV